MAMMKNFKYDFVKRTLDIVENCSEYTEYEVTLLLNCLLGMVALPIEIEKNEKDEKAKKYKIDCVKKIKELSVININKCENDDVFFRNIRNAIAHLNIRIECDSYGKNIESVELKNLKSKKCNLEFRMTIENLKKVTEFIAIEYLNRFHMN